MEGNECVFNANESIQLCILILFFFAIRMICGQRVRVEHAKARSSNHRGGPSHGSRGGE